MCFLLTNLLEPYERSEGILTGPVHCDDSFSSVCTMRIDGELHQSFMFTNTSNTTNVQLMGDEDCQMRIVAIGGGGRGYRNSNLYIGGGSGYIKILDQDIPLGVSNMVVAVGAHGYSSLVTVNGEVIVEAPPGSSLGSGNGYSGGGFWYSY